MVYVGTYALIYLHAILAEGIVSRDGLPRGVLPSGILKIEKYCPGLKVRFPYFFKFVNDDFHKHKIIDYYCNCKTGKDSFGKIR